MEYRAWINVPNISFSNEHIWEPFISYLEDAHGEFGPVLGWDDTDLANVVMSTNAESPTDAAQVLFAAVTDGLRSTGLADRYPTTVKIEVAEDEAVPA